MIFDSDVLLPQIFQIGDKPDHERIIFERDARGNRVEAVNLFAVTIRWPRHASGYLYVEQLMTLLQEGKVIWSAPSVIAIEAQGDIIVAAFQDSGAVATLDVGIDDVVGSVLVTASAGTIPANGFYRIESEYGEYTFSGSTVTFTTRGVFSTSAAAHSISTTILFAATKETVIPKLEFESRRDNF
ncbi:hypothetical protein LCGC14_0773710 [marine sediment metagenome]|uniref:Uncharacterized protein n=1 Tax=marine sediment metagenome TaxID=412755 RepID=A0A0F9Q1Q0_9ZZZZ